jgi:hypothetical protein
LRTRVRAGIRIDISSAMIAMTTSSSINVNPGLRPLSCRAERSVVETSGPGYDVSSIRGQIPRLRSE